MTEPLDWTMYSDAVDVSTYSDEERKLMEDLAQQIVVEDKESWETYGFGVQRDIFEFINSILVEIQSMSSDFVGEVLTELLQQIKAVDVDSLGSGSGFLARIPLLTGLAGKFKNFMARYEKLSLRIEKSVSQLDGVVQEVSADVVLLNSLYSKSLQFSKNLDMCLMAGKIKMHQLSRHLSPILKDETGPQEHLAESEEPNGLTEFVSHFHHILKELHSGLETAKLISGHLSAITESRRELSVIIRDHLLKTLPLWKNRIVETISLFRLKKAMQLQAELSESNPRPPVGNDQNSEVDPGQRLVDIKGLRQIHGQLTNEIGEAIALQATDGKIKLTLEADSMKANDEMRALLAQ